MSGSLHIEVLVLPREVDEILQVLEPVSDAFGLGYPLMKLKQSHRAAVAANEDQIVWLFGDNLRRAVEQHSRVLHDLHTRIGQYVERRDASLEATQGG